MEYILMADDTVIPCETLNDRVDVWKALQDTGGIAYYWNGDDVGWCMISATCGLESLNSFDPAIDADMVPNVIKLALMLE